MIPDIMVSLIPLSVGIILVIINFDLVLLIAILLLVFLTTSGNGYVRGTLACNNCKQKETGCPAYMHPVEIVRSVTTESPSVSSTQ